MRADQERVRKLLTEAVTLLCRNSLQYQDEVTVEGLIGVTLDNKDIFLVSIKETIENTLKPTKRSHDEEVSNPKSPNANKRQKHLSNQRRNSIEESPQKHNTVSLIQPKQEPNDLYPCNERLSDTSSVQIKSEKIELNDNENFNQNVITDSNSRTEFSENDKKQGQNHDRSDDKNHNNSYNDTFSVPGTSHDNVSSNVGDVIIKKETEDPYFVIDSDEEDYDDAYNDSLSDNSRSNPGNFNMNDSQVMPGNWQSGDATLELVGSDADLLGDSHFQRGQGGWQSQFDMSQMTGSSNSMLPDGSFAPGSQFNSPQDPNQRIYQSFNKKCPICHINVLGPSGNLKRHIRKVHYKEKCFTCPYCEQKFTQKYNMNDHIKRKHDASEKHSCQICKKDFKVYADLEAHIKICEEKWNFTPLFINSMN